MLTFGVSPSTTRTVDRAVLPWLTDFWEMLRLQAVQAEYDA